MYLGDRTWPELGDHLASESVALIPLGSTEQHGPHLPLATDFMIAEGLARTAAERTETLCTPTIPIGVSPHHRQFHGTLWVDPPAFRSFVENLSRNLTYHGVERIVYINAHGGNVEHLREVGRRLRESETAFAVEWMWDRAITDLIEEVFEHPGPHGGPKETAMIQHLAPELVRDDQLEAARDGGVVEHDSEGRFVHGGLVSYDAIETSSNGVYGDQTDATAEVGERLFEAAFEHLEQLLTWLEEQSFEDLMAKPHVDPLPGSRR